MMRVLAICVCFLIGTLNLSAQSALNTFIQRFDPGQHGDTLYYEIDTINNPNNIWFRGKPNKTFFSGTTSLPNAIFTADSLPYPINDTSSFTIIHRVGDGFGNGGNVSEFYFNTLFDSDSFFDYGIVEMSIDRRKTWINLLSDTANVYGFPVVKNQRFSGPMSADTSMWSWPEFWGMSYDFKSFFQDHQRTGDSIYFRFTFISDSIQNNLDGWIIDDIIITDGNVGIAELGFETFTSKAYPNPSDDYISISFENPKSIKYTLSIFDNNGKVIDKKSNIVRDIKIDLKHYSSGIYNYRLFSEEAQQQSLGKFLVE